MKVFAAFLMVFVIATAAASPSAQSRGSQSRPARTVETKASTDKATYGVGEPVVMKLSVTNSTQKEVTISFSSSQRYNFRIRGSGGRIVWDWSKDRAFTTALGTLKLAPGETVEYTEKYTEELQPGKYWVIGSLTAADNRGIHSMTTFQVSP